MSLLDGKPKIVTEEMTKSYWGGCRHKTHFRCHLCGLHFQVGDVFRFVYCNGTETSKPKGNGNFLVCQSCDGPDVIDRWEAHCELASKFFWLESCNWSSCQ